MTASSSSSTATSFVTTALGIPLLIAAVAVVQLKDNVLEVAAYEFFHRLSLAEQMSVLALLFATVFGSVVIATAATQAITAAAASSTTAGAVSPISKKKTAIAYPLDEIAAADNDMDKFKALFPTLKEEILTYLVDENELLDEGADWIDEMLEYSVPGGKLNRGTTVLAVYRTMKCGGGGSGDLTPLETAQAAVLGWTIEFLQAFFLVADDVMDDSQTRRGQPCWYKLPRVGLIAINDSFLLESFCFQILRTHFRHEPYYLDLLELLLDVTQKTEIGQLLDLTSQPANAGGKKVDLDRFTLDRYRMIVKYKTAFYSFYLPVAMGMLLSGIRDANAYQLAKTICCIMGEYFQIQDDYLDCFGDPEVIGKVGTDIQDNKCSWLVVQALGRCNPAQRAVLEKNYGCWDDAKVTKVKNLYRELELPELFQRYEEESYRQIQSELDKVTLMPRDVFELLLLKIYKRSK
jgi:farnesyl diphosphate synthase